MKARKYIWLLVVSLVLVLALAGCKETVKQVRTEETYQYVNKDPQTADTDAGMTVDGVLDEAVYQDNHWLYLHNEDGGNIVDIAMTSYYGEKGMYFVFDVTETAPIFVNLDRESYMNSSIEMYLVHPHMTSMKDNGVFELDLMPTGDMLFKQSNGRDGYINVATSNDIMACLGTTTKGGAVNTPECYGYSMELFIPWAYMQWLDLDADAMRNGFVYVNPAHITSYNLNGTDTKIDRYWYHYVQQNGVAFSDVSRYFRFNGQGVMGGVPVTLEAGAHCTITGAKSVIPGMNAVVTVKPDQGYALSSVCIDGQEQIQNVSFNKDGSVTLTILGTNEGATVSAQAEAVTPGNKTLSGKIILNNLNRDSMKGLVLSYIGPKGERPLEIDAAGNFQLTDLEQGYYTVKAEKDGYTAVSRSIYLNRDFYTELVLEYGFFRVTQGKSWVLDKQNEGVLYKKEGAGQVLSNTSYRNFTLRANLKYDPNLAKLGKSDEYTQQRTGVQMKFSNGKTWHIDLLKEDGKYILQYAKISGNNSLTGWQTIHTLDAAQVNRYTGKNGIQLSVMRQGNYAVIWLDQELIKIEILDEKYNSCSAQLGFESWAANRQLLEVPFRIAGHSTVNVKGSPFLAHAKSWNISGQYEGVVHKEGTEGVYTLLDSVLITNDVTTVARDLSPDTLDYSLAYVFKFSNGEQLRIRLHHTDQDGAYKIQTMNGSTVVAAWKTGYTLTQEQAAQVMGEGIAYRVRLSGTTAYVYLDDTEVCTYNLSQVIATGKPSGVDKATAKVSFSLDGNYGKTTQLPFKLVDMSKDVLISVADCANGTITADKESCKLGDTVTLTVTGDPGYYYTELLVNGQAIHPDQNGQYRFKATENVYIVTGTFDTGKFQENKESAWNVLKQNQNLLYMNSHTTGDSGWLAAQTDGDDLVTTLRDATPAAKNFAMVYDFDFSNGETLRLRLDHTNEDGKYRIQVAQPSTVAQPASLYTLTAAQEALIKGQGLQWRTVIQGSNAIVYLEDQQVCTVDLSQVIATGNASGVDKANVRVKLCMEGNLKQNMEIPFRLIDTRKRVQLNIAQLTGGKVTAAEASYQLGDTVVLTVAADSGYSQKLYINGQPLLLDWKTKTYSFVATESVYEITGSFEPSLNAVAKDANRWDTANQAHGIFNAYYPDKDDAWLLEIKGEYRSIAVKAQNYQMGDDGNGVEGFAVNLGFKLSNGKEYIFRIIRQNGKYYCQRFGIGGNDWTKKELNAAAIAAICGEGADFKLERTGADTLSISVNGIIYDTYKVDGATAETKVTTVILGHYGNKGEKIAIPYTLKVPTDNPQVQLQFAPTENGTVTAQQEIYQVGDTVVLVPQPAEGYLLKRLSVKQDGQPVAVESANGTYQFVAQHSAYTVEAEFSETIFTVVYGNWNLDDQFDGSLTITDQKDGTTVLTAGKDYREVAVTVKEHTPSKNTDGSLKKGDFSAQISFIFDDGKEYQVRLHNTDADGNYKLQNMGGTNSITGWKWQADLTAAQKEKLLNGDGVEFRVKLVGANAELWVDGQLMKTVDLGAAYDGKLAQIRLCFNGNKGMQMQIPFQLISPLDAQDVQLQIAPTVNGTVTPAQDSYRTGDTVVLNVTPAQGYAMKRLVLKQDGVPVDLVDLKLVGGQYRFVAEAAAYTVEVEFAPSLFTVVSGSWDLSNQLLGSLTIASGRDGTTVLSTQKQYTQFAVTVKEHTPSKNADGSLKKGDFSAQLSFIFDDGKEYQVRIHNTDDGNYKLQNMGGTNSLTGWKWQADLTTAQKEKLLNGDGVEFKVKLVNGNAELWVDGQLMKTVELGAAYAGKPAQVRFCLNGNKGVTDIQIPFALG